MGKCTTCTGSLLTDPCPVQVDGDEGGRNGEVVHERVQLQHEPELVARRYELLKDEQHAHYVLMSHESLTHPDEEVDHEEDVEGEVDLLRGVLVPRDALLHPLAARRTQRLDTVQHQRSLARQCSL